MNHSGLEYLPGRGGKQVASTYQLMEAAWEASDSPEGLLLNPNNIEIESNIPWNVSFEEDGGGSLETPMFSERLDYLTPRPHNFTSFDATTNDSTPFMGQYNVNRSLPIDMRFNDGHILQISGYTCLFFISLVGNLCVLRAILGGGRKHRKSRVNLMLLHLAIADLIVSTTLLVTALASSERGDLHPAGDEFIMLKVVYMAEGVRKLGYLISLWFVIYV